MTRQELLIWQLDQAWEALVAWVSGLTDNEFWWEPGPSCWTVRLQGNGHWQPDYQEPDPIPAPLTTIGWKVDHLASCKFMYWEYGYGPKASTWDDLEHARTAIDAVQWLGESHQKVALAIRAETDLDRMVLTNWGERWPAWRVFWTLAYHDLTHGAEIGALRDLYRSQVRPT